VAELTTGVRVELLAGVPVVSSTASSSSAGSGDDKFFLAFFDLVADILEFLVTPFMPARVFFADFCNSKPGYIAQDTYYIKFCMTTTTLLELPHPD
jgi:hypothetical protein